MSLLEYCTRVPSVLYLKKRVRCTLAVTNDTNDTNDKQSPKSKSIFGDDEDFGVTFLKQPEDARFAVEIAEFGLDAEPEPET